MTVETVMRLRNALTNFETFRRRRRPKCGDTGHELTHSHASYLTVARRSSDQRRYSKASQLSLGNPLTSSILSSWNQYDVLGYYACNRLLSSRAKLESSWCNKYTIRYNTNGTHYFADRKATHILLFSNRTWLFVCGVTLNCFFFDFIFCNAELRACKVFFMLSCMKL